MDSTNAERSTGERQGPIYHIDWWVTVPIIVVGGAGGLYWISSPKSNITDAEVASVNPANVPSFDRISLHQNIALVPKWDPYALAGQQIGAAMPLLLLIDPEMRRDWTQVIPIAIEANMVELGFYSLAPFGPKFITRYRPLVYYSNAAQSGINRNDGNNKDSFYSGHVASVAVSSFCMAKMYCDYHPDASPWLIYGVATLPPLAMGVIRFMTLDHFPSDIAFGFAIGAAVGILDPELHRIDNHFLSFCMFSSPTMGTGLTMQYRLPETAVN
ncbi:MAG TPA: phosphatase PAP2 family protein [Candidatus Kapabacteria bacterium]